MGRQHPTVDRTEEASSRRRAEGAVVPKAVARLGCDWSTDMVSCEEALKADVFTLAKWLQTGVATAEELINAAGITRSDLTEAEARAASDEPWKEAAEERLDASRRQRCEELGREL